MITKADAAKELLARRKARTNFRAFIRYVSPHYQFEWFHTTLANYLQAWVEGRVKNLIVNIPPRHGKSEQVSRHLPAYIFGLDPDAHIIGASYATDLAQRMNRDIQRIITNPRYTMLFPQTTLNRSNVRSNAQGSYLRNSDIFEIVGRLGSYRGVGRGGSITGMGGKFIIVDDPIKDKEEAKSPTIKDSAFDWLTTTLFSRQADDTARKLVTVTRWAFDDPVGRLLALCDPRSEEYNPNAEKWEVLNFPALAYDTNDEDRDPRDHREPGEPLWPSKFSKAFFLTAQALNALDFEAIYQQRPVSKGTAKFARHNFTIVNAVPRKALRVRYWDKAGTKDGGAYTVGTLLAFDGTHYYVENVIRVQLDYSEREPLIKETAKLDWLKYGSIDLGGLSPVTVWIEQEPGSGGKESADRTILNLAPYPAFADRVTGDKEVRANGVAAQVKAGNFCVSAQLPELEEWFKELERFPKGKYKDRVDSLSGAFNKLSLGWEDTYVIVEDISEVISPY